MNLVALRPIRLRERARVSWLELFFDLIFVAGVAQVADPLREHFTLDGALRFAALFTLIWWAWTGYTTLATRFESDDLVQRALTVVQIFVVAAMAANARDTIDSASTAGFAAAYAVLRLLLVAQYLRARHLPNARALTTRYAVGHGVAAVLWLLSAVLPIPWRYAIWGVALTIDLGTPAVTVGHTVRLPPTAAHWPERFGLFTLILLGEAVVAVMRGMESQESWPLHAAASALFGMGLLFLIWWWYFDVVDAAGEQHVRSRADATRVLIWSYAHFPLYLGIVFMGIGIQRLVAAAAKTGLTDQEILVPAIGAALASLAMAVIGSTTSRGASRPAWPHLLRSVAVAGVPLTLLALVRPTAPIALVTTLVLAIGAQVALADQRQAT